MQPEKWDASMNKLFATVAIVAGLLSVGSVANAKPVDYGALWRYQACMASHQRALNAINPSLAKLAGPNAGQKQCAARAPYAGIRP